MPPFKDASCLVFDHKHNDHHQWQDNENVFLGDVYNGFREHIASLNSQT